MNSANSEEKIVATDPHSPNLSVIHTLNYSAENKKNEKNENAKNKKVFSPGVREWLNVRYDGLHAHRLSIARAIVVIVALGLGVGCKKKVVEVPRDTSHDVVAIVCFSVTAEMKEPVCMGAALVDKQFRIPRGKKYFTLRRVEDQP